MFYNQNYNNCCRREDNYGKDCNEDNHYKNNKREGYCVKYIQEVCCCPSYYNENEYDKFDKNDDKHNGLQRDNYGNDNCKKQNRCCFCKRFFGW